MSTYTAHAEWDNTGWWIVTVSGVPGAITQCKRLDQVPRDAAEVITLIEGRRVTGDEVDYEWSVPDEDGELAQRAAELREEATRVEYQAAETSTAAVRRLRDRSFSYRDIGTMTKMSYQRAQQIGRSPSKGTRRTG